MQLYEIPCFERIISVGEIYRFGKKTETMSIGEIGFFLHYDEEWQKNDIDFIRKHLAERRRGECYIEAVSIYEALKKFYNEFEGAKIGGTQRADKAVWINDKEFIHELPFCPRMNKNKNGDFCCDDDTECVLENVEAPEKCVMSLFRDRISKYGEKELTRTARNIDGFKFIELRTLMPF